MEIWLCLPLWNSSEVMIRTNFQDTSYTLSSKLWLAVSVCVNLRDRNAVLSTFTCNLHQPTIFCITWSKHINYQHILPTCSYTRSSASIFCVSGFYNEQFSASVNGWLKLHVLCLLYISCRVLVSPLTNTAVLSFRFLHQQSLMRVSYNSDQVTDHARQSRAKFVKTPITANFSMK